MGTGKRQYHVLWIQNAGAWPMVSYRCNPEPPVIMRNQGNPQPRLLRSYP